MKKPFYGWAIVSMGVLGNALQGGLVFWSMGLYTSAFEDHFGAPRARVTLIETFLTVTTNLCSPFLGYWVDKKSARAVVGTGMAAMGLGLVLISFAGTLLHVWAVYATLIPLGVLALGVLPSSALISRWFRRRRGLALGISVTGSSIGGFLAPPLLTYLFAAYGWRTALQAAGVVLIVLAPLVYRTLANHPEDRGLEQEPEDPASGGELSRADRADWRIRQILATSTFWCQVLVSGCLLAVTLGMLANLSLHAKDLGFAGQQTAVLYSIIAFCSFGGKIAFGTLTDRIGLKRTGYLSASLMVAGMLTFLSLKTYPGLLLASFFVGMATGGVSPIWTTMIARAFGARSFGRAIGIMNPMHIPITAPSAPIAGYISDTTGHYDLVFVIYIGLCVVAATALALMRPPVHPGERQPA